MVSGRGWLDADQQRAWRRYLGMHARLMARLHRDLQARAGLSLSEYAVLVELTDVPEGRLRPGALGAALQWEKSRVSKQVARMVRRGLVSREECPDDARGDYVVVTAAGRRATEAAAPDHVALVQRLVFDSLDADQVRALAGISDTVLDRLAREPGA